MPQFRLALLLILLAGCRRATIESTTVLGSSGQAVLPDSATVDGVLTVTHSAAAFARAPQLTLDGTPLVVFDDETNGDFDLTNVYSPLLLPDGRLIATPRLGFGWVMLFNADGKPARVLARSGEGPREVRVPATPIPTGSDTVLIADAGTRRMNWLTADAGIVRSVPLQHTADPGCLNRISLVTGGRLLGVDGCSSSGQFSKSYRVPAIVFLLDLDFGHPDTVVALPGTEIGPFRATAAHGGTVLVGSPLRFSRFAAVAPWGTGFASADGEGGYLLERRGLDGRVVARIRVNAPRRPVTPAIVEAAIQHELGQILNGGEGASMDPKELERRLRSGAGRRFAAAVFPALLHLR